MSINLTKTLKAKQAESNLSIDALAKAVGVSTVSIRGVLRGKSKPNATTAKKYAAFLGIDVAELASAKVPKAAKAAKAAKAPKAAKGEKVAKVKGKPGRKPGRKPGKAVKGSADGLGSDLVRVATAAAALLDDDIALAVHVASKSERDLIARLLAIG